MFIFIPHVDEKFLIISETGLSNFTKFYLECIRELQNQFIDAINLGVTDKIINMTEIIKLTK